MESPIEKPFKCSTCFQSFTNEDHLQVHRKRHEMSLSLGFGNSNGTGSTSDIQPPEGFTDETPTPTRFFRISEEVGFFQDIQNVNPFDEQFARATSSGSSSIQDNQNFCMSNDTLNTPQVLGFTPSSTPLPPSDSSITKKQNLTITVPLSALVAEAAARNCDSPPPPHSESLNPENQKQIAAQKSVPGTIQPVSASALSAIESVLDLPQVDKRTELLERNRAAAVRSRERRKQWVSELEMKNKQLISLLAQVHSELKRIRGENAVLKEELSKHSNCNVTQAALRRLKAEQLADSSVTLQVETIVPDLCTSSTVTPSPVEVTILPKQTPPITGHTAIPVESIVFPKPSITKVKRGRPRKGFEKRASVLTLPPTQHSASIGGPPTKIKILPLAATKTQTSPAKSNVIVLHRGTTT